MEQQELQFVVNSLGETKPLSKIPTRQLLRIYANYRQSYYGWGYDSDDEDTEHTKFVIKAELDKREHIPNRKEGKLLRQKNAKKLKGLRNKDR